MRLMTPIDFLLSVVRDADAAPEDRVAAAASLLPYVRSTPAAGANAALFDDASDHRRSIAADSRSALRPRRSGHR